ncbi:MAG: adenine phosphoribosyltransferase [Clostridia bacterium]|nr:adenine phosphoribosyltransferase [Clostridia bacterium]
MEFYKVTLNGKEYGLPIVEIKPGLSIAVLDMLSSKALSHDASYAVIEKIKESGIDTSKIDVVLSAETKGITLAYQVAEYFDREMVILRKEQKIYYKDVTKAPVDTYTTKNPHYLYLENGQIPKLRGKNVLIVDDVVSTGSSLRAIESIIEEVGGNIYAKAFVFAEGDAAKRDDVIFVDALPLL